MGFPIVPENDATPEVPSEVEILPTLASISLEAPYRLPASLDLDHLRAILAARWYRNFLHSYSLF